MSACHTKLENWQRTVETADKVSELFSYCLPSCLNLRAALQALAINKDNLKALFRKGKALGEMGWFEKAEVILSDLLTKNPAGMFL